MTQPQLIIAFAAITGGAGLWLLLPRGGVAGRMIGLALGLVSLGLFAALGWKLGARSYEATFWTLAAVTLVAAAATITFRNPVYCAVWFALSLLGTAGLFLFQGAQFLAVATIVVYAGAILVTFLFVLMLAQSSGRAYYDRLSWEPLLGAATGAVLVGVLSMAVVGADLIKMPEPKSADLRQNVLDKEHVAGLGGELFSRHLIAVEVAGTLLLVALVGTIAMVSHQRDPSRQPALKSGPRPTASPGRMIEPTAYPYAPSIRHAPPMTAIGNGNGDRPRTQTTSPGAAAPINTAAPTAKEPSHG